MIAVPENINSRKEISLLGKFNARIGNEEKTEIFDKYPEDIKNDGGRRLI